MASKPLTSKLQPLTSSQPLVVIVGPTASGKSALAMALARKYNGEIICADSRTIYIGMDIGTAKPTQEERSEIKHHCLDIISPDQVFSAAQFKECAVKAIEEIHGRGKLPILVGGSGLYVSGVLYDYDFVQQSDEGLRNELDNLSIEELGQKAKDLGIDVSEQTATNKRHLVRLIERGGQSGKRDNLRSNTLFIGLDPGREIVMKRIEQRVDVMIQEGLIEEVTNLFESYGSEAPGLLAPGYKAFSGYLSGELSLDEARELFTRNDKQLAKRQMTWFKRDKNIDWVNSSEAADKLVQTFLLRFATIDS